jgi:hypothetical protein
MWVARGARYPYISTPIWWTRYHLLVRKVDAQRSATPHDRRIAEILAASAPQGSAADAAIAALLGKVYADGS